MRRVLIPLLVLLALPATAAAGGWATVGIASTPTGVGPGQTWKADIEIRAHGRTPFDGGNPAVIIRDGKGTEKRFAAKPNGKPGGYTAQVVFPTAGRWTYAVNDGYVDVEHSFPPVTIGDVPAAPAPARTIPEDDGFPWLALTLGIAGALSLAALAFAFTRRRGQLAA